MEDSAPGHLLVLEGAVADEPLALELPTGTVTFLLTDIEGSTGRWEAAPEDMTAAVPRHYAVLDEVIGRHCGVRPVEQGEGDSVVAAFARASEALAAALDAQRELAAATPDLKVRMAVHSGEAQLRDELNYIGHAVIRCARLRSCAHGGQVLVSDVAAGLVAERLPPDAGLVDLGVHALRDLARPERVWQLTHPDLQREFGPLRSLDAFRHNLPSAHTPMVGRTAELVELRALVLDRRLVTITGSGGVGKTRLAQQVGADLVDRFEAGVCWVELASVSDPDQVLAGIAAAVGVTEGPGTALTDALVAHLRSAQLLVVIDNCEHVVEPVAEVVSRVVQGCPAVRIVTTSREPIGVAGETTWRTPSLAIPPPTTDADVVDLSAYDAVDLFVERACQARPNFVLTPASAPLVASICARLDGIPLAIELAAARVRTLPIDRLSAELEQRFRVLTGGARTVIARQRTLEASIDWSHDLLDEDERRALRRLGTFAGGFTLDSAEMVCADEHLESWALLDVLSRLVDKSLVQLDDSGRYRLLETIRAYALDRARESGDLAPSRDRHLEWCLTRAREWDLEHVIPTRSLALVIEREHANLLAALEWSLETEPAVRLLGPLALVWATGSRFAEGEQWGGRVLDRLPEGSPEWAAASAHLASGFLVAGGPPFGVEHWARAQEVAEHEGDAWSAARLGLHRAVLQALVDPRPTNLPLLEAAVARIGLDDAGATVLGLALASMVAGISCQSQRVDELLTAIAQHEISDWAYDFIRVQSLAMHNMQVGRFDEGTAAVERSLETAPPSPRAGLLFYLGQLALHLGDPERMEAALSAFPPPELQGVWRGWRAGLQAQTAYVRGDRLGAIAAAHEAHAIGQAGVGSALVSSVAAHVLVACGEYDDAEAMLASCMPADVESPAWTTAATPIICLIGLSRGDTVGVERQARRDLTFHATQAQLPLLTVDLELLASAAVDPVRAVRLAAAAHRIREMTGHWRADYLSDWVDAALDSARTTLGERFDEAWAEGMALSWEEACDYALRRPGGGRGGRPAFGWDGLTPTERAVVDLVVEGLTNPQIAERLLVETSTVKTHVHHVFTKLAVSTRSELVGAALAAKGAAD